MKAAILCGGRGTRHTATSPDLPKPLVPVCGRPLLHHLMDVYAAQGFTQFVLAAGYGVQAVRDFARTVPADWQVEVVDTGQDTGTGARLRGCLDRLGDVFFATYGDGLSDIDLASLHARHADHPGGATVTAVPLPSQYGTLQLGRGDSVDSFTEKPVLADHLINAGFFVFDRRTLLATTGDDLEREVLPQLAKDGKLFVYRHDGFWQSMDTYKDQLALEQLARSGTPPWLR